VVGASVSEDGLVVGRLLEDIVGVAFCVLSDLIAVPDLVYPVDLEERVELLGSLVIEEELAGERSLVVVIGSRVGLVAVSPVVVGSGFGIVVRSGFGIVVRSGFGIVTRSGVVSVIGSGVGSGVCGTSGCLSGSPLGETSVAASAASGPSSIRQVTSATQAKLRIHDRLKTGGGIMLCWSCFSCCFLSPC